MINTSSSQHPELTQTEIDPWDAPLSEPSVKPEPVVQASPISSHPILSADDEPDTNTCSQSPEGSPTVKSLLRWGLKLSPTDLNVAGWREALALLVWQSTVLQLSQMLIEDELKLKALSQGTLRIQIQKALALLFWLGNDGAISHA